MSDHCLYCDAPLVLPYGNPDSKILLVGEFPGWDELKRGVPFVGKSGKILEYETTNAGLDMWRQCRIANLWVHEKNKLQDCFEMGVMILTKEMENRAVLLMGSDTIEYFLSEKVMSVSGLVVKSALIPKSTVFTMVCPNPAIALHQPPGEFRMAIRKFVDMCKEKGVLQ